MNLSPNEKASAQSAAFDYYAFPRTGSHFLMLCLRGLFDLEVIPQGSEKAIKKTSKSKEVKTREKELRPLVLWLLSRRWPLWEKSPVKIYANPSGELHSTIQERGLPIIAMIRDPYATVFSLYNLFVSRFGYKVENLRVFIEENLLSYRRFYEPVCQLRKTNYPLLLIRHEELQADPGTLDRICRFLEVAPKLKTSLVFSLTQFQTITRNTKRTFYRQGTNDAWKKDPAFLEAAEPCRAYDWTEFGY